MSEHFFIGVDVGTGSARAGLVSTNGKVVRTSVVNTKTWNPRLDYYEQSSNDIWSACVKCIKVYIIEILNMKFELNGSRNHRTILKLKYIKIITLDYFIQHCCQH